VITRSVRGHPGSPSVAEQGCAALGALGSALGEGDIDDLIVEMVEAGAIEAIVGAMRAHGGALCVGAHGSAALAALASGRGELGDECRHRAVESGAAEEVVRAVLACESKRDAAEQGCCALANLCADDGPAAPPWYALGDMLLADDDDLGHSRRERVVSAGGVEAIVACMRSHVSDGGVAREGCRALRNVAHARSAGMYVKVAELLKRPAAEARRAARLVSAHGVDAVVGAMTAHAADPAVQVPS